ncbi:hypothetical protein OC834_001186 [Tilletia horrida]|nr:hypothetical protein OC834_001186 [Tilletia horrida]
MQRGGYEELPTTATGIDARYPPRASSPDASGLRLGGGSGAKRRRGALRVLNGRNLCRLFLLSPFLLLLGTVGWYAITRGLRPLANLFTYASRPLWDHQLEKDPHQFIPHLYAEGVPADDRAACARHNFTQRTYPLPRLIDATIVSTELDLLEVRLRELEGVVDTFVIVESGRTFMGEVKNLSFAQHRARFARWESKIEYLATPGRALKPGEDPFNVEREMREAVTQFLQDKVRPSNNDLVFMSDVDEIPAAHSLALLKACRSPLPIHLQLRQFVYSFEYPTDSRSWRAQLHEWRGGPPETLYMHSKVTDVVLADAGWHCSFCFRSISDFVFKMSSYSHSDRLFGNKNYKDFLKPDVIQHKICTGEDVFGLLPEAYTWAELLWRWNGASQSSSAVYLPKAVVEDSAKFKFLLPGGSNDPPPTDSQLQALARLNAELTKLRSTLPALRFGLADFGGSNVAELGVLKAELGLARFQDVLIHPALEDVRLRVQLVETFQHDAPATEDVHVPSLFAQAQSSAQEQEQPRTSMMAMLPFLHFPSHLAQCQNRAEIEYAREGLADLERSFRSMALIQDRHSFLQILLAASELIHWLEYGPGMEDGERQGSVWTDGAERVAEMRRCVERVGAEKIWERMKRESEAEGARLAQEGIIMALIAGIAAQSVSTISSSPSPSTQPLLDHTASAMCLSSTIIGLSGALAYAGAYLRLSQATALPFDYAGEGGLVLRWAHGRMFLGWSLSATMLFTMAGLASYAWIQLNPAPASSPPGPATATATATNENDDLLLARTLITAFLIYLPTTISLLALTLRSGWKWYEVEHVANVERARYLRFRDAAGRGNGEGGGGGDGEAKGRRRKWRV